MKRENWKSRFGFVMATAGFAIGLGNIWRFPYIMGQNGGGAFLILYILIALFIALPLLTMEMSLGRKAQMTPIEGFKKLSPQSKWPVIGYVGMFATVLMMCYYVMIMAWVLIYGFNLLTGSFNGLEGGEMDGRFQSITADSTLVFILTTLIFVLVFGVIARGLQNGLEQVSKIFMPILFVLFIVLAIWANTLEGSVEGLIWYLKPDFSKLSATSFLDAMGQAFYSIGVGMTIAFVFGSYLHPTKSNIPFNVSLVVLFDTGIALIAGLLIFPALFAFGMEPDSGFGLLFVTLTNMFLVVPFGQWIGVLFYFLVFIAGLTSILSAVEGIVATVMETVKITRTKTLLLVCAGLLGMSIPNILGFGPLDHIGFMGKNIFGVFDFLSGNVFLPLSALLISLFVAKEWKFNKFQKESNVGAKKVKVHSSWKYFVQFLIPLAITIILVYGLISAF